MSKGNYQITVKIDLGDLGQVDGTVDGSVQAAGLFGDGSGYYHSHVSKVIAHIPVGRKLNESGVIVDEFVDVDVTRSLKYGLHNFCDELESLHEVESKVRGA